MLKGHVARLLILVTFQQVVNKLSTACKQAKQWEHDRH